MVRSADNRLDVALIHRHGLLAVNPQEWSLPSSTLLCDVRFRSDEKAVELEGSQLRQRIEVLWTVCNFGGRRPWLQCPQCKRRAGQVYLSARLACRRCLGLAYPSQREGRALRVLRALDKAREALCWTPEDAEYWRPRPKGMHRRTFERLVARHDSLAARVSEVQVFAFLALAPSENADLPLPQTQATDLHAWSASDIFEAVDFTWDDEPLVDFDEITAPDPDM